MTKTQVADGKGPGKMPLIIALLSTALFLFFFERDVMRLTGGIFSYPLDDPFIHMQVARNLALNGTWGINAGEFGSASSSLLYTLLLTTLFRFFSVHVIIPFIVNCIAGGALLCVIDSWLVKQGMNGRQRTWQLLAVVFFMPLPVLIICGMEHVLQALFSFLFLAVLADWVKRTKVDRRVKVPWSLFLYAALVTGLRFEGLFLLGIGGLVLLWRRRFPEAILLGIAGGLLILSFGIYSLSKGSYFFPNSVLMKSDTITFTAGGIAIFVNSIIAKLFLVLPQTTGPGAPGISFFATRLLLVLLPATYLFFREPLSKRPDHVAFLGLLTAAVFLHLCLAATGWFYRYEAYLVVCSVVIVGVIVVQYGRNYLRGQPWPMLAFAAVLAFMTGFPLVLRSGAGFSKAERACLNIHDQQYQMSQFLRKYYKGDAIALNDIGAAAFYGGVQVVDLWGLGSIEVTKARRGHYWTPAFLDSLVRARGVTMAIVYEPWFDPALLGRWTKVATWQMPDNVICGSDVVTFYAVKPADSTVLRERLRGYTPALPAGVRVAYY